MESQIAPKCKTTNVHQNVTLLCSSPKCRTCAAPIYTKCKLICTNTLIYSANTPKCSPTMNQNHKLVICKIINWTYAFTHTETHDTPDPQPPFQRYYVYNYLYGKVESIEIYVNE